MIARTASRLFSYALPGTVQGRVYKPSSTIEFDPKGDTLVYSCTPMAGASVFFPMPYSLGTCSIPAMGLAWYTDLLSLGLGNAIWLGAMYAAILPHCWHLYNLRFRVDKIWYVRGGYWKIQTSGINQVTNYAYTESGNLSFLDGQLTAAGELAGDAKLSASVWIDFQEMKQDQQLVISREGEVHDPELMQALFSGYTVEVDDFTMNYNADNSFVSQKCLGLTG